MIEISQLDTGNIIVYKSYIIFISSVSNEKIKYYLYSKIYKRLMSSNLILSEEVRGFSGCLNADLKKVIK